MNCSVCGDKPHKPQQHEEMLRELEKAEYHLRCRCGGTCDICRELNGPRFAPIQTKYKGYRKLPKKDRY